MNSWALSSNQIGVPRIDLDSLYDPNADVRVVLIAGVQVPSDLVPPVR